MYKHIALISNWLLTLGFCFLMAPHWTILASPLLHTLTYLAKPQCYSGHCSPTRDYQVCAECGLPKWIRMHHCFRCNICIHKYDHHCVLLELCIGQANQKYYILLLWAHLYSSFLQVYNYFISAGQHISINQDGSEEMSLQYIVMAILIIFYFLNILVVSYLAVYHTKLLMNNQTTYEVKKRPVIKYLTAEGHDNPFNKGTCSNIIEVLSQKWSQPKEWKVRSCSGQD